MKFSDLPERKLSGGEKRKRETNVKKLKKHKGDFEKRYGKDAESVMYAVATKRAKGESVETEGYQLLPPMDREKYQDREGLEGPIMTKSGKVVYYDPKAGDYYDPDTDMYISYDDFRMLDKEGMYKVESEKRWKSTSLSYDDAVAKYGKDNVKKGMYKLRNGDDDIQVFVEWGGDDQYEATERAIEDALSMFDDMLDKGEDELRARAEAHEYLKGELQDYGVRHGDYESKHAHGELEKEIVQIMNYRDKGGRANEAKGDDPISAFDPETQAQLKDLKARYPHAPDQLSAVLKALVDIKKASKGQDDELGTDVDSNEERIKGLEARVDKLEKDDVGEAKKPAPDHNMRARMRAQEKIRKALAKKKDDKEPVEEAHQINWPYEDMETHAYNAIRHGMHAYDAFDHVFSMAKDSYQRDWLLDNKDDIIKMFASYGLQTEGFASDAQRKAAFANGYDPKKKKKKESIDTLESQLQEIGAKLAERHGNDSMYDKCWDGYEKVPGKKRGEKGSCRKKAKNVKTK